VSACNPLMIVHQCNYKVDGITRYIENYEFTFDNTFSEAETNEDLYFHAVQALIPPVLQSNAELNIFAYGQTGSGKTFTMVLDSHRRYLFSKEFRPS
jgi:kinesin family protein 2/24